MSVPISISFVLVLTVLSAVECSATDLQHARSSQSSTVSSIASLSDSSSSSVRLDQSSSYRQMTIKNYCDEDIWLYFTSGAAPNSHQNGPTSINKYNYKKVFDQPLGCSLDADCINGAACNTDNGICFWEIPVPSTGTYRLPKKTGESTVSFPVLDNYNIVWSGNMRACVNSTCSKDFTTEECDQKGCPPALPSPVTLVEFTLQKSDIDFYDVSILNGYNMAVEMAPVNASTTSDPYHCGNPGGIKSMTGYGSCTWDFNPISNEFRWVEWNNAAKSCSTDKDCLGDRDSVCGMTNKGIMQCGQLLGYWTLDTFCGYNLDQMYPDAKCRAPMPSPNEGQTLWNLLACVDVPSCYQQHTGTNCCGCTDWQDEFKDVSPSTERCVEQNPNWLEYVKPGLTFMKEACPSAYTYPYDDMSSTFVCSSNIDGGVNNVDYTITYCPQNSGN